MRILICGGRDYCDQGAIKKKLAELYERYPNSTLIHGGAPGADSWSGYIGGTLGFTVECHTAQWGKYGKEAGPMRNQEMLDSGVDLVVAFPGGRGTADMVERARFAGVPIEMVDNTLIGVSSEAELDSVSGVQRNTEAWQGGRVPSFDPLDPSMSGDSADPALVLQELTKVYGQVRKLYAAALSSADPEGRVALGACCDAISRLQTEWFQKVRPIE